MGAGRMYATSGSRPSCPLSGFRQRTLCRSRSFYLEASHLLYVTSNTYDPDEEGRIPHDDPTIGYDWTATPPIT